MDFSLVPLTQKLDTGNFNNETKNILREIIGETDNAQKALNELDKAEMELARKSDDELAQMDELAENLIKSSDENANLIQNLENSAQFGRDMFILREKNYNLVEQIKSKRQALKQTNDENAQEQIKQEINALKKEFFINEQKLKLENAIGKENLNAEIILKTEKNRYYVANAQDFFAEIG